MILLWFLSTVSHVTFLVINEKKSLFPPHSIRSLWLFLKTAQRFGKHTRLRKNKKVHHYLCKRKQYRIQSVSKKKEPHLLPCVYIRRWTICQAEFIYLSSLDNGVLGSLEKGKNSRTSRKPKSVSSGAVHTFEISFSLHCSRRLVTLVLVWETHQESWIMRKQEREKKFILQKMLLSWVLLNTYHFNGVLFSFIASRREL